MRKLLLFAAALFLISFTWSCTETGKTDGEGTDTIDSGVVEPLPEISPEITVVGEAYDGADRSIIIVTHEGDTLSFDLPEIDPDKKQRWRIGDTVTIKYVKIRIGGTEQDSVTALLKGRKP